MFKQVVSLGAFIVFVSGCAVENVKSIDSDFGNTVRQNIAVQTINPDAGGPDGSDSVDGQRAQQAVERMRERTPEVETTSLLQNVGGN